MGDRDFQDHRLDQYLGENTTAEPALLKELAEKTKAEFVTYHMISGHIQGRFLSIISKMMHPNHILEVGTYTGYATICLAEGLAHDGKITTIDRNPALKDFYTPFFERSGYHDKINAVISDAYEYIEQSDEVYDLVFMDALKKRYIDYFELILPKMPSGGIILADNVLWKGKVLEEYEISDKMTPAIMEFNRYVAHDDRVEVVLLPLRDGISVIRKK
ncbi:methyltransferase [Flavobacteriaceae bacterium Ap0902]|nr:methyltransferase [Flavobacteriaceae bacterium Ap0902]